MIRDNSNPTQRLTLAGRSRKDKVQIVPRGFQVPPWNGTAIPLKTVHPSRTDRGTTTEVNRCSTNKTHELRQASHGPHGTLFLTVSNTLVLVVALSSHHYKHFYFWNTAHQSTIEIIYDIGL